MSRYSPTYYIDVTHPGLGKFRRIKGKDEYVVERMAEQQIIRWDEQWARQQEREIRRQASENRRQAREEEREYIAAQEEEAANRTAEALALLEDARGLLEVTLKKDDAIDFNTLKRNDTFAVQKPALAETQWSRRKLKPRQNPLEPDPQARPFQAKVGFLGGLVPGRRRRKEAEATVRFQKALADWRRQCDANAELDQKEREQYEKALQLHEKQTEKWEADRSAHEKRQKSFNVDIDKRKELYVRRDADAIADYCQLVLHRSEYPDFVPKNFDLDYNPENNILVIDYQLPVPDDLPNVTEWRYVKKTDDFTCKSLAASKLAQLYDEIVYQIALRTIHELFEADTVGAISSVVFNGWIDHLDRSVGKNVVSYVVSLQATKEEFLQINLAGVDPKECFRGLKGVGAARLSSLTPVAPVATLNRDDPRFVDSRTIDVEKGQNIAAIDWSEFEHLIRQVFELEFAENGADVQVTQASRDGGVDAVVFDPDPLRGGKIVIQAKRYTNVVGVSAVRDLFGTVQHEGAIKGILVTTSSFGKDAFTFAKDKPLTLLDGQHLLYLLHRHGYKARIDLAEARQLTAN